MKIGKKYISRQIHNREKNGELCYLKNIYTWFCVNADFSINNQISWYIYQLAD